MPIELSHGRFSNFNYVLALFYLSGILLRSSCKRRFIRNHRRISTKIVLIVENLNHFYINCIPIISAKLIELTPFNVPD